MSVVQQIKDRLDIVQYIQEYVPDLKKAGRYYKACCPFHSEKSPSFVVNPDTQSWRCFGACAEGGDIFAFSQKRNNFTFAESLQELGTRAGVEIQQRSPEQLRQDSYLEKLQGMLTTVAQWYHEYLFSDDPNAQSALAYTLEKRGFNEKTISDFQIGYAPDSWSMMLDALLNLGYHENEIMDAGLISKNDKGRVYDRFRNRLMIPIKDERGHVVGFGARALAPEDQPKYLNSPQSKIFDKSGLLFALDRAKTTIRQSETVVIVEGYMDAIQAHQAGYTNVVAQMGTALTDSQLKLIAPRYANKIIMALDADEAGQNATRRSLEVARQALQADYVGKMAVDIRVMQIDGAKDPDDVLRETPEKWGVYVQDALPIADFVIDMETAHIDKHASVQERQRIAQNILPILSASESNFYKRENLQKLALRLHIPETDLLDWAQQLRRIEQAKAPKPTPPAPNDGKPTKVAPSPTFQDAGDVYDDHFFPAEEFPQSEEPPLFFGDEPLLSEKPKVATLSKTPAPQFSSRYNSRITEAYCMRMLLHEPRLLSQVNRKLRQLAQDKAEMVAGPLAELNQEDFSQGDYRAILIQLQAAMNQDDREPIDYVRHNVDPTLLTEVENLLQGEEQLLQTSVSGRWASDLGDSLVKFERQGRQGIDMKADVVRRALAVRQQRLQREQQELRFLLEDAKRSADLDLERHYYNQSGPTLIAIKMIHKELGQNGKLH